MAQGAVKNPHKISTSKKTKSFGPKTGNRVIKPKKAKLISQRNIMKKGSAGLSSMTEKNLAEKAGHLELLKGGKRE
ncbi:uncharacterized protein BDZ99DRAFT_371134, partial [Mytilinidion resinicola]